MRRASETSEIDLGTTPLCCSSQPKSLSHSRDSGTETGRSMQLTSVLVAVLVAHFSRLDEP